MGPGMMGMNGSTTTSSTKTPPPPGRMTSSTKTPPPGRITSSTTTFGPTTSSTTTVGGTYGRTGGGYTGEVVVVSITVTDPSSQQHRLMKMMPAPKITARKIMKIMAKKDMIPVPPESGPTEVE